MMFVPPAPVLHTLVRFHCFRFHDGRGKLRLMKALGVLLTCLLGVSMAAAQTEPTLKVGTNSYSLSELLKRPDVEAIRVEHDSAYGGREMRYQAIRAAALFAETKLRDDDVVQFRCLDGFVASISKERIMRADPGQSTAYIAIEDPKSKWPDLPGNPSPGSAGPFYLVWLKPELSGILQEEWPYKIAGFEVKGRLQDLYPKIFPKHQEAVNVARGLKLFQQVCFACHTLNRQGPSRVGPDLNLPLNPTEYLKESILPRYIRDPKSIRTWESSKMPGFGPEVLSDEDIANLVAYLKEMAFEKNHSD
jgi:mono/diheme cytochrome c family protein